MDFADYTRLAGQEDADYRTYSPWCNQSDEHAASMETYFENSVPSVANSSFLTKFDRLWHDSKAKMKEVGVASKWALWERKRLEEVIHRFRKRNKKLKEVLQIATASRQQGKSEIDLLLNSGDAKVLGLTAHAELRQLIAKGDSVDENFFLESVTINLDAGPATIHSGTCEVSIGRGNSTKEEVLIEYKDWPPTLAGSGTSEVAQTNAHTQSRIHQLASLLQSSGSNRLGTLPFKGIINQAGESRSAFLFYYPTNSDVSSPESLHSAMNASSSINLWPLEVRFRIAQNMAKSIGAFHADGWVHKSVRSHSVVFFKDRDTKKVIVDSPYLVDFEYSRPESGSTLLLRDNNDEKNLYRHPEIQDVARSSFSKNHDIYSLGVVLLEIALWQTARTILKRTGLDAGAVNAVGLQKMYIDRVKKRVAHLMGESYQSAVLACLESKYKDQMSRHDFPRILTMK